MLATTQSGGQSIPAIRARLLGQGGVYIAAVFLVYLALGVGLLKTLDFFTRQHLPARIRRTRRDPIRSMDAQGFFPA